MTFGSHAARNASRQLRPRGSRRREFRPNSVPVPRKGQVFRSFTSPPVSERRPRKRRPRSAVTFSRMSVPAAGEARSPRGVRDGKPSRGPARGPRAGRLTRLSPSRALCSPRPRGLPRLEACAGGVRPRPLRRRRAQTLRTGACPARPHPWVPAQEPGGAERRAKARRSSVTWGSFAVGTERWRGGGWGGCMQLGLVTNPASSTARMSQRTTGIS